MFAYVRRFIYNCRHKNNKLSGPLITEECNKALTSLIRFSQLESFKDEIQLLSNGASLCNKSNLLSLNPFLDHDGVLRVGGRMKNSPYNFNKKHPVILCGKNTFTKLLMRFEHNRLYHAGPQLLLASLREHYWPIGGRVLARATVKKCVICTRHFLVGRPLMSVPFPAPELAKPNYQAIEKIRKEFWRRWSKEFLAELQQRSKWKLSTPEPCIGDMVIIKEENSPPQRWRLGRITKLHSGTDGITRVVDVYTAKGTIRRAIHNIVRLPAQEGF
ncbi:hypothetical protein K1T71_011720 [Dendrolimus kikuchii]|uniref:Uncharacterized protein n=1 Tax=Dendrolimus kikuchii TaxID=765133 RepID=A0ACC1CMB4_9NEOP|nr:hypothetical protein K1T71_011720 [Dendrolimus kikuchii]